MCLSHQQLIRDTVYCGSMLHNKEKSTGVCGCVWMLVLYIPSYSLLSESDCLCDQTTPLLLLLLHNLTESYSLEVHYSCYWDWTPSTSNSALYNLNTTESYQNSEGCVCVCMCVFLNACWQNCTRRYNRKLVLKIWFQPVITCWIFFIRKILSFEP